MGHRSFPKQAPVVNEAYRRYVAALPCWLCGAVGRSQAAHADTGKGLGLKSDDRTCMPLCATSAGVPGCHDRLGMQGVYTREGRRRLEVEGAAATIALLKRMGLHDRRLAAVLDEVGLS